MPYSAGIDVGSTQTKAVLLDPGRAIVARALIDTGANVKRAGQRALDELITALEKKKLSKTARPHKKERQVKAGSRTIPARVKRETAERDLERCTFIDDEGRRCTETRALEFHHEVPFPQGGEANAENIRLLCRPHNQLQAERDYGAAHVARMRQQALFR